MTDVVDKTVLITGGASGIGLKLAESLGRQRARIVIWDIDSNALERVRQDFDSRGISVATFVCDLTDRASVRDCASRVIEQFGGVDILINNAGIVAGALLLDLTDEQIERTFAVNTMALYWTVRAFLPGMIERDAGHIVTIASAGGLAGTAKLTDYCASKFAAVGFDDSLRAELRHLQSSVVTTIVCPFYINTGMFDGVKTRFPMILPILDPDKVVERIIRAIRSNKPRLIMPRFVYSTWLLRLMPVRFADRMLEFFGVSKSMDEFTGRAKSG